jgi:hypothetical protein
MIAYGSGIAEGRNFRIACIANPNAWVHLRFLTLGSCPLKHEPPGLIPLALVQRIQSAPGQA